MDGCEEFLGMGFGKRGDGKVGRRVNICLYWNFVCLQDSTGKPTELPGKGGVLQGPFLVGGAVFNDLNNM